MEILNIHKRTISQSKTKVAELLETLASKNDMIWPHEKWPRMKLNEGLKIGSKGGHGPIRYWVEKYTPKEYIQFHFTKPKGLNGYHCLEITPLGLNKTEIKHTIKMDAKGIGILTWGLGVRWLHDALIEDAFDKIENHFLDKKKKTKWNLWVKILRSILK